LPKSKKEEKSKHSLLYHFSLSFRHFFPSRFFYLTFLFFLSIDRDAQLLANRIALLKQEEMKTWKKIEETKKRTNDISGLKKRNEEKV
jgi:hypothetical protein